MYTTPELTIVIPTLNEAAHLPLLLADIYAQRQVSCEVVVSDGGSADGTPEVAGRFSTATHTPCLVITGTAGRPGQIDRGAELARGRWLLILHADSRLPDQDALRTALDQLRAAAARAGEERVAGRFSLRFTRDEGVPPRDLHLMEQKARLNRPGCIHGDQGLLLATDRYRTLAPLPADPPMLAETRLADRLLKEGEMLLFPRDIVTSARRFAAEGVAARQTLNALIMNFAAIDWPPFFAAALPLYRPQAAAAPPISVGTVLAAIHQLLQSESPAERRRLWRDTGAYVAANAWQLAFLLDASHAAGDTPLATPWLDRYDRHLAPLVSSTGGQRLAQLLVWCWFQWRRPHHGRKKGERA